jgi:hypothetical protein
VIRITQSTIIPGQLDQADAMLRAFTDSTGTQWRVWDVVPSATAHRYIATPGALPSLNAAWASGWLCFECNVEKRRLAPIPGHWVSIDEPQLEQMCADAEVVPDRRQRNRAASSLSI